MKNLKDYLGRSDVVISCETDKEAKFVNDFLAANGGRNLYYDWKNRLAKDKEYHKSLCFKLEVPNNTYCSLEYFKSLKGTIIIPASEFMKQNELIVGRWYDFNNYAYRGKTAAKFRGLSKDGIYFLFSEFVGDNKHEFYNGSWNLNKCTNKLTDLTEIQPFLPENHPDKQNKWIPKVGDWVKRSWSDGDIDYFEIKSFDRDRNKIFVDYSKYYRNGKVLSNSSDETFGINGDGRVKDTKALPHEIPDNFILPEKWCIKVTESNKPDEIYEWRDKRYYAAIGYIHNDKWWSRLPIPGYTEITLEQFKKYVLKEEYNYHIDNYDSAKSYDFKVDDIDPSSSGIYIPKVEKRKVNTVLKLNTDYPKIDIRIIPKVQKVAKLTIKPIKIKI